MSEWRRRALEDFPEFRRSIDEADSLHGVFFELLPAIVDAYRKNPPDEKLIARIFLFAEWCSAAESPDVRGPAMVSFYEHLPESRPAWRDLPNRVSAGRLASIRQHLQGYLRPDEYTRAMADLEEWSV